MTDDLAPRSVTLTADVASAAANADASGAYVKAPFDGVVSGAAIIASAAITGADTESRTVQLHNRGDDGSGTTLVASLAFEEGTDAAADDETPLTLSVVANATEVAQGDILEFTSLHVGTTGLAGPAFTGQVTFSTGAE